jgi:hypothetical protein
MQNFPQNQGSRIYVPRCSWAMYQSPIISSSKNPEAQGSQINKSC